MKRRALVTGGNRGIGRASAAGLTAAGHDVIVGLRDIGAAAEVDTAIWLAALPADGPTGKLFGHRAEIAW